MSDTYYNWMRGDPPKPDVYITHRGSNYTTLRYWDGVDWFMVAEGNGRGGLPFNWPHSSITPQPKKNWISKSKSCRDSRWYIRKIHETKEVFWGNPYKHYTADEVLRFLVHSKVLPSDWKECYQDKMRDIDFK